MTDWQQLTIYEQMANIGSEVNRIFAWQQKNKVDPAQQATKRAVDLVEQTATDPKNSNCKKELRTLKQLIIKMSRPPIDKAETQPQTLINFFLAYGLAVRR